VEAGRGGGRLASKNNRAQGDSHRINVTERSRHAPTLALRDRVLYTTHTTLFTCGKKGGTGQGGGEGRGKGEDRWAGYMNAAGDGLKPTPSCKEI
jgi:hypothetical protein